MKKLIGKLPKIKIDPNKMDYIEKGAGGSRRFQYIFCGIIILVLLITKLLFASELTLEETKEMLTGDPYKITKWIAKNIKSIGDDLGYGQLPKRTFKYKKGDCEDIVILARYFIGDRYETYLIVWRGKFRKDSKYYRRNKRRFIDHAVVAIKINENEWQIMDKDRLITGGKTLVEIIKINCDLRKINVERALIMDLLKLRRKVIREINLGE